MIEGPLLNHCPFICRWLLWYLDYMALYPTEIYPLSKPHSSRLQLPVSKYFQNPSWQSYGLVMGQIKSCIMDIFFKSCQCISIFAYITSFGDDKSLNCEHELQTNDLPISLLMIPSHNKLVLTKTNSTVGVLLQQNPELTFHRSTTRFRSNTQNAPRLLPASALLPAHPSPITAWWAPFFEKISSLVYWHNGPL